MNIKKLLNLPIIKETFIGLSYIQFGWTLILISILLIASSYHAYVGHSRMQNISTKMAIDFDTTYYRISGFRCGTTLIDNELTIFHHESSKYSPCVTNENKSSLIKEGTSSLRGFHNDKFLFVLIIIIIISLSGVFSMMTKNKKNTKLITILFWTVTHSILFFNFYLDYSSARKFTYNNHEYNIMTMVRDGESNYYASPLIGKRLHHFNGIGRKVEIK